MSKKRSTGIWLAGKNIKGGGIKNICIIILTTFTALFVFGGSLIVYGMSNGVEQVRRRLGADLIIVPEGKGSTISRILLEGEAGFFYLDDSVYETVKGIEGVECTTCQYYFASASAACCDAAHPIEIIGFDPETDFIIEPWIEKKFGTELEEGSLIIGSDIELKENNTIKLYDEYYTVRAVMDKTGTGMDESVYASKETILNIRRSAMDKGFDFFSGEEEEILGRISGVMVKIEKGADIDVISRTIDESIDGIEVVEINSTLSAVSETLDAIKRFYIVFAILFLAMAMVALFIVYFLSSIQRKREYSLMRLIGMTGKLVTKVNALEALFQGIIGSAIGITAAGLLMYPFSAYFNYRIRQPFAFPSPGNVVILIAFTVAITLIIGIATSLAAAYVVCRRDAYQTLREGE